VFLSTLQLTALILKGFHFRLHCYTLGDDDTQCSSRRMLLLQKFTTNTHTHNYTYIHMPSSLLHTHIQRRWGSKISPNSDRPTVGQTNKPSVEDNLFTPIQCMTNCSAVSLQFECVYTYLDADKLEISRADQDSDDEDISYPGDQNQKMIFNCFDDAIKSRSNSHTWCLHQEITCVL